MTSALCRAPACRITGCRDRTSSAAGWACVHVPDLPTLAPMPTARRPGWSATAVLRCPECRCTAYSVPGRGRPWRRCHGCGAEFNPEEE